jgi:hypothetical protein
MAVFSGEVTIKVKFKDLQVAVGYGMTSAIIKHRCVEQAYANSPWSKIKDLRDKRFEVVVEKEKVK